MREQLLLWFSQGPISPEWATVILAASPILELRGSIPFALSMKIGTAQALWLSVIGNMIPIPFILKFLGPVSEWLRRFPIFDRFFAWLFARTRKRSKIVERMEFLGLLVFVGIPLPMTGAWTGALAAFLFDLPFLRSLGVIFIGVLLAGTIVLLASLGIFQMFGI